MRFLPLFLDVTAGTVALIGAGPAALNKLRLLRAAGADVRWYSDDIDVAEELLLASASPGRLELSLSDPLPTASDGTSLIVNPVVSATDGVAPDDLDSLFQVTPNGTGGFIVSTVAGANLNLLHNSGTVITIKISGTVATKAQAGQIVNNQRIGGDDAGRVHGRVSGRIAGQHVLEDKFFLPQKAFGIR